MIEATTLTGVDLAAAHRAASDSLNVLSLNSGSRLEKVGAYGAAAVAVVAVGVIGPRFSTESNASASPLEGMDISSGTGETFKGEWFPSEDVAFSNDSVLNTAGLTPVTAEQASWAQEQNPDEPIVEQAEILEFFAENPQIARDRVAHIIGDNADFYQQIAGNVDLDNNESVMRFLGKMQVFTSEQNHYLNNSHQGEDSLIDGHTPTVIEAGTEFIGFVFAEGEWEHVEGTTYRLLVNGEFVEVDATNVPLEITEDGELRTVELKGVCGNEQDLVPEIPEAPEQPTTTTSEQPATTTTTMPSTTSSTTSTTMATTSTTSSTTSTTMPSTTSSTTSTTMATTSTTGATTTTDKVPSTLPTTTIPPTSEQPTTTDKEPEPLPTTTVAELVDFAQNSAGGMLIPGGFTVVAAANVINGVRKKGWGEEE